jgi:uncharacterized membrane protein (DUF4010 family)
MALDTEVVRLLVAAALGLFLGLEREWSEKDAGVRTFSLAALLGATFEILARPGLLVTGALLVASVGLVLSVRGLTEHGGLSLTTAVSLLVAYGAGVLVGAGLLLEGVTVAVVSALVLALKRELHGFAETLSREEVRAASEFAVLAFVVYPLLPAEPQVFAFAGRELSVEPRVGWLMVVSVAGLGIVNYAVVRLYGSRGLAVTGFFGGLASSTAVVGSTLDHLRKNPDAADYALAAVLLANAAMAVRNLVIALAFTLTPGPLTAGQPTTGPLLGLALPLGTLALGSVGVAVLVADWEERVPLPLDSPFTLRYALGFGGLFLAVVVAGGVAQTTLGAAGLLVTALLTGLVSSAGATTSVVLLYRSGAVSAETAVLAVLLATGASIAVKVGLTLSAPDRRFTLRVAGLSAGLFAVAGGVALGVAVLGWG